MSKPVAARKPEIDLARVICPLHELADPGARGFTMGEGDWPLRGFIVRQGDTLTLAVNATIWPTLTVWLVNAASGGGVLVGPVSVRAIVFV